MAFQLKRARKTHRAQALRLERKKISLFIHQAWKFRTFVTNMLLLLSNEFRPATIANAAASPALSLSGPFKLLVLSKFQPWISWGSWRRKVPSPSDIFAAQDNPDWETGKPHRHDCIPGRGARSATERQLKYFYLKKDLFYYFLPQNTEV